ncbi:hypothetical protein [Neptuniibacter sp. QD37_11]|uniref:hypothetical protein n=1 Tax=Neptuniibacter sp. QD37_11 TaxID=3398209 RepID=UPI0039F637F0
MAKIGSWIVKHRDTGEVYCEIFSQHNANFINAHSASHKAVPALEHLSELNKSIKAENSQ